MSYLLNGSNQYFTALPNVTTFPMTIGIRAFIVDASIENGCPFSNTSTVANLYRSQLRLTTSGLVAWAVSGTTSQQGTFGTYVNGWNTFVCSAASATLRELWVNGTLTSTTVDSGPLSGIDLLFIGARWNTGVTAAELFFNGRLEECFMSNVAWDATKEAAFRTGTAPHDVVGGGVQFYRNFLRNTTAPGPGNTVSAIGAPALADHSSVFTGQNKKRLTITGIEVDVLATAATLNYDPDTDYLGSDTLTIVADDSSAASANADTAIFVSLVVDANISTVTSDVASLVADGIDIAIVTVTLLDAVGGKVVGHTVTLDDGAGSSSIGAASGPSDSNGEVIFVVMSNVAEAVTYTATDTTASVVIVDTVIVTFTSIAMVNLPVAAMSSASLVNVLPLELITSENLPIVTIQSASTVESTMIVIPEPGNSNIVVKARRRTYEIQALGLLN